MIYNLEMQKASHPPRRRLAFLSSGDRTRTDDLRVMSPTSYQLLHPAISLYCFILISLSGFNRRATPETSGLTPQYLFIALFYFFVGFSIRRATPENSGLTPQNILVIISKTNCGLQRYIQYLKLLINP